MAYICDNCGKTIVMGVSRRHRRGIAGKRWKTRAQKTIRMFKPNLQMVRVTIHGISKKLRLCTKCLKKFRKDGKLSSFTTAALA
jgi:large subunit ribosomal protein L28